MKPVFPPQTLHWFDGMLLMPYHFRYAHHRSDAMLHYRMMLEQPNGWGIVHVEYNKAILGEGIFELTKLEAVLPDGTCVSHDAYKENARQLQVDLRAHAESLREKPGYIFLAMPSANEEELHVGFKRYDMADVRVTTYGEKGQEYHEVLALAPHLHLFFGEVLPARFSGMPIAQVAWESEGYTLTPYIPPMLMVEARSDIGTMVLHLLQRMREKAQYLVSKINNPQQGMSELVIDEFKFYVACLTESMPYIEALLSSNSAHPFSLYLALTQVAGRLATMGIDRIPPQFKPYNHNDIYASYDQVRKFILRMIVEGVVETFIRIPFRFEDGMFKVELKPQWRNSDVVIAAHPKVGVQASDLNSWVMSAVIGSENIHPTLKTRRILGAPRSEIERLPDVMVAKGTLLYAMTFDDDSVIFGEDLCVENTLRERADFIPAEMGLYVKVRS